MFTTVTTLGNGWNYRIPLVTQVQRESWENDQEMLKSPSGEENSNWRRHVSRRCSTERHNFHSRQSMPSPPSTAQWWRTWCLQCNSQRQTCSHVLYLDVWKCAGDGNLRQIAWKLEIYLWQYTGLLGTLKKQTPCQAQCFTGSPLTCSLSCSVPEIVECLECKEISGHLKCNNVAKQQYQNCFNKWQNQWNNVAQLGGYYCEAKHG